jgi:hypothetical protein
LTGTLVAGEYDHDEVGLVPQPHQVAGRTHRCDDLWTRSQLIVRLDMTVGSFPAGGAVPPAAD